METAGLWKAALEKRAPSHSPWKTPPVHHPRFPQFPQPLPATGEVESVTLKPSSMSPVSVLDVPGTSTSPPLDAGEKDLESELFALLSE